jgi:hypothetical protein
MNGKVLRCSQKSLQIGALCRRVKFWWGSIPRHAMESYQIISRVKVKRVLIQTSRSPASAARPSHRPLPSKGHFEIQGRVATTRIPHSTPPFCQSYCARRAPHLLVFPFAIHSKPIPSSSLKAPYRTVPLRQPPACFEHFHSNKALPTPRPSGAIQQSWPSFAI